MPLFHKHSFVEIFRTYAPPAYLGGVEGSEYLFERLRFGVTTVVWRCLRCGQDRKEEALGKMAGVV